MTELESLQFDYALRQHDPTQLDRAFAEYKHVTKNWRVKRATIEQFSLIFGIGVRHGMTMEHERIFGIKDHKALRGDIS